MPTMYCPQCGKDLELNAEVRFCRYCGFALSDMKDVLHGYTEVKRQGYKYTNLSYILLLALFWVQYFNLIAWRSIRGGDFLLILIIGFIFGLWFMGNWVVDRPANYVKEKKPVGMPELVQPQMQGGELPPSQTAYVAAAGRGSNKTAEMVKPSSVTDETTRQLTNSSDAD